MRRGGASVERLAPSFLLSLSLSLLALGDASKVKRIYNIVFFFLKVIPVCFALLGMDV